MNFSRLDAFGNLDLIKRQYKLPSGQRIDLLCRDAGTGDLVAVELKHASADRGIVAQIFAYLEELKPKAAHESVGTRAVLITGQPSEGLGTLVDALSQATGFRVDWYCYSASFALFAG